MTVKWVEVIAWAHEIAKSEKRKLTTREIRDQPRSAINSIDRSIDRLQTSQFNHANPPTSNISPQVANDADADTIIM